MSDAAGDIVFDKGIDLAQIQKLLAAEREKRSPGGDERVCTLNLIAVYFSREGFDRARPALEAAGTLHPARLVALVAQPKEPGDAVRAQVSVTRAGGSVALEQIVLTATGAAVRHLQSAMLGLLVPELPVVFVWGGRPEGALFDQALEKGDRVIVDSGTRPLSAMLAVSERVARGAPIGDLAWARIFPWQSTAAEMLDLPNLREHRARIRSARVVSAGQPGAEAALLAGWLASRLPRATVELEAGPEPTAEEAALPEGQTLQQQTGRGAVHPPPIKSGNVALIHLEAPPATFTIKRERGLLVADVQGDDDGYLVHRVRLPAETPGRLIGLELKLLAGLDELYAAAIKAGARLASRHLGGKP